MSLKLSKQKGMREYSRIPFCLSSETYGVGVSVTVAVAVAVLVEVG